MWCCFRWLYTFIVLPCCAAAVAKYCLENTISVQAQHFEMEGFSDSDSVCSAKAFSFTLLLSFCLSHTSDLFLFLFPSADSCLSHDAQLFVEALVKWFHQISINLLNCATLTKKNNTNLVVNLKADCVECLTQFYLALGFKLFPGGGNRKNRAQSHHTLPMPSSAEKSTRQAVWTSSVPLCQSPHLCVAAALRATSLMNDLQEALCVRDTIWSSGSWFV